MRALRSALVAGTLVSAALAAPLAAQWGGPGWGGGWGDSRWDRGRGGDYGRRLSGPPEGQVIVSRFVAEGAGAAALRTGAITVTGAPTGSGADSRTLATFEAAVVDQLAQLGYRTDTPAETAGQVAELHISSETIVPQEVKKPVSGELAVGTSNRGSMVGMAVNVDLSKPRGAIIATRLEARIRDKSSGAVLWEGRADINTREGSDKWSEGVIANRLAAALFDQFPGTTGESGADRP